MRSKRAGIGGGIGDMPDYRGATRPGQTDPMTGQQNTPETYSPINYRRGGQVGELSRPARPGRCGT
jgi:hypothetical protein